MFKHKFFNRRRKHFTEQPLQSRSWTAIEVHSNHYQFPNRNRIPNSISQMWKHILHRNFRQLQLRYLPIVRYRSARFLNILAVCKHRINRHRPLYARQTLTNLSRSNLINRRPRFHQARRKSIREQRLRPILIHLLLERISVIPINFQREWNARMIEQRPPNVKYPCRRFHVVLARQRVMHPVPNERQIRISHDQRIQISITNALTYLEHAWKHLPVQQKQSKFRNHQPPRFRRPLIPQLAHLLHKQQPILKRAEKRRHTQQMLELLRHDDVFYFFRRYRSISIFS